MIQLSPFLLAMLYGLIAFKFSAWRTAENLKAKSKPLRDPELMALTARLAKQLELSEINVWVYDVPQINGIATPDGRIYLTQGFLQKYRSQEISAEEMISVIAHELGHVAMGHTRKRMIDFGGQNAVRYVLSGIFARIFPIVGPFLANAVGNLLMARLSRQDEFEADAYAAALLTVTGIGTKGQKSLFHKMARLSKNQPSTPAWMMSHPPHTKRIAAIEALEQRWTTLS